MTPPLDSVNTILPADALKRLRELLARRGPGERTIIGLVGQPGAGKSTVAAALSQALSLENNPIPHAIVPMDGFHLASAELARLGRAERKGAPDTFDVLGYLALLQRLRSAPVATNFHESDVVETIYAPAFHREIEEAIAGEIPVTPDVQLVITEGNYLLLDMPVWRDVRSLLDDIWSIDVDPEQQHAQLLARHIAHGRSREAARAWIEHTDEPNARRIAASVAAAGEQVYHLRLASH